MSELLPYAVFAISIATAYFSWCQKEISRAKLKLDLYNRRFKIYEAVVEYYLWSYDKSEKSEKEINKNFVMAFRESKFLFKHSDGIYDEIDKFKNMISGGNGIDREKVLLSLEDRLSRYLNFEEIEGWSNKVREIYDEQVKN